MLSIGRAIERMSQHHEKSTFNWRYLHGKWTLVRDSDRRPNPPYTTPSIDDEDDDDEHRRTINPAQHVQIQPQSQPFPPRR